MEFLKQIDWKDPKNILKAALVVFVILILLGVLSKILGPSFNTLRNSVAYPTMGVSPGFGYAEPGVSYPPMPSDAYGGAYGKGGGMAYDSQELSVRNIYPIPPIGGGTSGNTAEEFEVTDYNANIETRNVSDTCATVAGLKAKTYVIFENANTYDRGCSFTFKVEHGRVEEILAFVKGLDPKDLSENTHTIKQVLDDFTAETEVLEKKKEAIDATLKSALNAYDSITALATKTQDVETLAKIIESKMRTIERLTQESIAINTQLDRLARSKAEQTDRLDYTYFHLNIFENKYVDIKDLKESWKAAFKQFVQDINKTIQAITINLISLLLLAIQYVLYFFILLVIVKYGWKATKHLWNK